MYLRSLLLICFSALVLSSCVKDQCRYTDSNITASTSEDAYMLNYFNINNITGLTKHQSGVYYKIDNPGTGATPGLCNTVVLNYNAYRFGFGNTFDSYTDPAGIAFVLGNLIIGVKKLVPSIKAGGAITLYIPPSLAYGNEDIKDGNGTVILPANSYIKFQLSLLGVR